MGLFGVHVSRFCRATVTYATLRDYAVPQDPVSSPEACGIDHIVSGIASMSETRSCSVSAAPGPSVVITTSAP